MSAAFLVTAALTATALAQATHTVTIKDFKFDPPDLTVHLGDTIEWKNADPYTHTATTTKDSANAAQFDSHDIKKNGAFRYVVKQKGTYNYFCVYHPNMKAKLTAK